MSKVLFEEEIVNYNFKDRITFHELAKFRHQDVYVLQKHSMKPDGHTHSLTRPYWHEEKIERYCIAKEILEKGGENLIEGMITVAPILSSEINKWKTNSKYEYKFVITAEIPRGEEFFKFFQKLGQMGWCLIMNDWGFTIFSRVLTIESQRIENE